MINITKENITKELNIREKNKNRVSVCFSSDMSRYELKKSLLEARIKSKSFHKNRTLTRADKITKFS